jgi:hypothetical protein
MEEIELHDWNVTHAMDNEERRLRSVNAYWLPQWYAKVADLTFPTTFHDVPPETFPPSMVRWEHKSPKDSEHWGPVTTRNQAENLFYTSLRCKTNPGTTYCLRPWYHVVQEWRCFWNGGLTAISGEVEPPPALISYLTRIALRIPFYRCVVDIAVDADGKWWLVEFNSWETNSGAHLFEWTDPLLYGGDGTVQCRWLSGSSQLLWSVPSTLPALPKSDIPISEVQIVAPHTPAGWILKDDAIYVCDDVWLVQFDLNLQPRRWKRGPFRFSLLEATTQGLKAGEMYLWDNLTPAKISPTLPSTGPAYPPPPFRYGVVGLHQGRYVFCRWYHEAWTVVPY